MGDTFAGKDQDDVIAFLRSPRSYAPGVDRVDVIDTHISKIFLAGDRVYKLKRAVKFPYLDFSSQEQRHDACDAELALNRRTAPELYLEVCAIGRTEDGAIGWEARKPILDWVVVMRRFDQNHLFDSLAKKNSLSRRLMQQVVDHIVNFQSRAVRRLDHGGAAAFAEIEASNLDCLTGAGEAFLNRSRLPPCTHDLSKFCRT